MTQFVLIKTPLADAESLSTRIWELPGILGIEELPADGSLIFRPDLAHHFVRFDGRQQFDDWLRTEEFRRGDHILLKVYHTGELPDGFEVIARGTVEPEDYLAKMREQHHGRQIGPFWVGPPWEKPGQLPVIIEPGTAFGLGDHPTTQMCLELLSGHPRRVLDFGAGSGILSIAAAKLWPDCELTLVEIDRQCWPNIEHNFTLNGLPVPPIYEQVPAGAFDLVLANIYLEILKSVLTINAPHFIISGLLGAEQLAALSTGAFQVVRQLQREEWFALELRRC
ncbi:MAG: Ribosomal protein L11 methyltransferase [Verrucomicrobiae bacterium]|nr:Ribosomal protein L11 methyltransferase [Verrucomicrobiae bacterium]